MNLRSAIPAFPRTLALGDVGVTSRDDEVIFFNPAQLVVATGFSTSGERYTEGSSGGALSAVTRFNGGGVAIGMRANSVDGLGSLGGSVGQTAFSQTSLEASIGLAQVVKGIRVGVAAKYAEQDLGFS